MKFYAFKYFLSSLPSSFLFNIIIEYKKLCQFNVYKLMMNTSDRCTHLWNHHHNQGPEHFQHSQTQATTDLFFFFFLTLGIILRFLEL